MVTWGDCPTPTPTDTPTITPTVTPTPTDTPTITPTPTETPLVTPTPVDLGINFQPVTYATPATGARCGIADWGQSFGEDGHPDFDYGWLLTP
ncbi:MAG: hypothetical protein WCP22_12485 [Chlamydiota bacterium]